ncbi:hypothetical protein QQ045_030998 [Rhodiola kirilowii]
MKFGWRPFGSGKKADRCLSKGISEKIVICEQHGSGAARLEEVFFDSQVWLDSDIEDFYSVNGGVIQQREQDPKAGTRTRTSLVPKICNWKPICICIEFHLQQYRENSNKRSQIFEIQIWLLFPMLPPWSGSQSKLRQKEEKACPCSCLIRVFIFKFDIRRQCAGTEAE